jgi:ribosomal protein RSM22 (predicted rRNA methylase)
MEAGATQEAFTAKDPSKKSHSETQEETEKQDFFLNYQREHTVAYLHKKMPYHFMVYKRLLSEVRQRMPPAFAPESVLDYGAGLGSGLWAATEVFGDQVKRVAAVEPNVAMRKLGKYLTEEVNDKFNNSILWVDSLSMVPGVGGERGKFDIVILGYVLQEVPTAR